MWPIEPAMHRTIAHLSTQLVSFALLVAHVRNGYLSYMMPFHKTMIINSDLLLIISISKPHLPDARSLYLCAYFQILSIIVACPQL